MSISVALNAQQFIGMTNALTSVGIMNPSLMPMCALATRGDVSAVKALQGEFSKFAALYPDAKGQDVEFVRSNSKDAFVKMPLPVHGGLLHDYAYRRYPLNEYFWDRYIIDDEFSESPDAFGNIDSVVRSYAYGVLGGMLAGVDNIRSRAAIEENWDADADQWIDEDGEYYADPGKAVKGGASIAMGLGFKAEDGWLEPEEAEADYRAYVKEFMGAQGNDAVFSLYAASAISSIYTLHGGISSGLERDVPREISDFKEFKKGLEATRYAHLAEVIYISQLADFSDDVERYAKPMLAVEEHLRSSGVKNPAHSVIASAAFFLSMGLPEAKDYALNYQRTHDSIVTLYRTEGLSREVATAVADHFHGAQSNQIIRNKAEELFSYLISDVTSEGTGQAGVDSLIRSGNYIQAVDRLSAMIEQDENDAEAHLRSGAVKILAGRGLDAVEDLDRAIELNPGDAVAHLTRGYVYHNFFEPEKTIANYKEALRIAPNHLVGQQMLDNIERSRPMDRISMREKQMGAIERNPNNSEALSLLGMIELLEGNYAESIKYYDRAIDLDPSGNNFYNRALAKEYFGRCEDALEDYQQALEHGIENPDSVQYSISKVQRELYDE